MCFVRASKEQRAHKRTEDLKLALPYGNKCQAVIFFSAPILCNEDTGVEELRTADGNKRRKDESCLGPRRNSAPTSTSAVG